MANISDRIALLLKEKGLSTRAIEQQIGCSNGVIARCISKGTDISSQWVSKIIETNKDINPLWLLTGEGSMLRADNTLVTSVPPSIGIPGEATIYSNAVTLRLMEKIDEKDAKIDQLQSELRQQAAELAAFKARYPNTVAARPEGLDPAKHASTKKHSSPPNSDNATSATAHLQETP